MVHQVRDGEDRAAAPHARVVVGQQAEVLGRRAVAGGDGVDDGHGLVGVQGAGEVEAGAERAREPEVPARAVEDLVDLVGVEPVGAHPHLRARPPAGPGHHGFEGTRGEGREERRPGLAVVAGRQAAELADPQRRGRRSGDHGAGPSPEEVVHGAEEVGGLQGLTVVGGHVGFDAAPLPAVPTAPGALRPMVMIASSRTVGLDAILRLCLAGDAAQTTRPARRNLEAHESRLIGRIARDVTTSTKLVPSCWVGLASFTTCATIVIRRIESSPVQPILAP
ncbi:hypothetical protein [Actinomycetospora succinea]|uniref:hypothetical protein n=1 Tax=Actinomycetospora succinea TaxID=663603 RepID=UPI00105D1FA4|nr:hypothetical protein [Actinomycetospora succinea]